MILQWFRGCFIAKCVLIGSSNYFAAGPKRSAISFDEAMILELVFMASMTADAFPKARKRMEEFVETFNRTSKQTIDLFEKTLGVYQATSVTDAQRRVHTLWLQAMHLPSWAKSSSVRLATRLNWSRENVTGLIPRTTVP